MFLHYGGDIFVFETTAVFLMRDVAKQSFHEPRLPNIYVDLGFSRSSLHMLGVLPTKNPMMLAEVQARLQT